MIGPSISTCGITIYEIVCKKRIMLLEYIVTEEQDVDILSNALSRGKFEFHRGRIGVSDNPFLVEREC